MPNQWVPMFGESPSEVQRVRADRATKLAQLLDSQSYAATSDPIEMGDPTQGLLHDTKGAQEFGKNMRALYDKNQKAVSPNTTPAYDPMDPMYNAEMM